MSTPIIPAPKKKTSESWEQRQKELAAEQDLSSLSPEERKKVLEDQKRQYEKEKEDIKKSLYGGLATEQSNSVEQQEKENLEAFKKLFDAAVENIKDKKAFQFQGVDVDNLGRAATHQATMTALRDHSQKGELKPGEIWERIEKKQSKPGQVGIEVEIDMGEDKNPGLGLTNLKMEMSLESLMNGGFIEKITRFTNLAFFASHLHARKQKEQARAITGPAPSPDKKQKTAAERQIEQNYKNFGVKTVEERGGLDKADALFEQGRTDTVAFSYNNGAVWGTLDTQGAPADPQKLQEAIDKLPKEKNEN